MIVLVSGPRKKSCTPNTSAFVNQKLDAFHAKTPITLLVHGAADGVDTMADTWARKHQIKVEAYPAEWDVYGKQAGAIRNSFMLGITDPDTVICFKTSTDWTPGTKNMFNTASAAGKKPVVYAEGAKEAAGPADKLGLDFENLGLLKQYIDVQAMKKVVSPDTFMPVAEILEKYKELQEAGKV